MRKHDVVVIYVIMPFDKKYFQNFQRGDVCVDVGQVVASLFINQGEKERHRTQDAMN